MGVRRVACRLALLAAAGCTVITGVDTLEVGADAPTGGPLTTAVQDAATADAATPLPHSGSTKPTSDASTAAPIAPPPVDAGSDADAGEAGAPVTVTFTKSLLEGQQQAYGPFEAQPGTSFDARTTGTGDDDLFLRFGQPPTVSRNDCASDFDGANEHCRRTVPSDGPSVYLLIDAWLDCSYTLTVTYVPK